MGKFNYGYNTRNIKINFDRYDNVPLFMEAKYQHCLEMNIKVCCRKDLMSKALFPNTLTNNKMNKGNVAKILITVNLVMDIRNIL